MKLKINDKELTINPGASISHIEVPITPEQSLTDVLNAINGTLSYDTVDFIEDSDAVSGHYEKCTMINNAYTTVKNEDGVGITIIFGIREKTEVEKRLDALEESQSIQDGAIADRGDVVSEMMEV